MIIIAHRGNINGPDPKRENTPEYILEALKQGYDVEIDVWLKENTWHLGHDGPDYKTTLEFLKTPKLWCHAKNFAALEHMLAAGIHCFWHEEDAVTLTSKGYMWTFPGNEINKKSVCVLPERDQNKGVDYSGAYAVCTDDIPAFGKKYS